MNPTRILVPCCATLVLYALGCSPPPGPAASPTPVERHASDTTFAPSDSTEPTRLPGGSSDGVTCEEARDSHPDEIGIGAKRAEGPEPSDNQFSDPLAHGTYLNDCEVPEAAHVSVCAAVMEGKAVGVTVAMSPADPDKERCVAGRVRDIAFPEHPSLRVVRTSF